MINWDEIKFNTEKARQEFNKLSYEEIADIKVLDKYNNLRETLVKARDSVFDNNGFDKNETLGYQFDLTFGLELYVILNKQFGFTQRHATNDDIWRFLQIKIIPDIVFSRWDFNDSRFYKSSRRIWLKTLWWYIHLSWMGNKEDTHKLLKNNTTDTIMQLLERPGLGYNIKLYREIMKQYGKIDGGSNKSRKLFRRVLILNVARLGTAVPELWDGGIETYVENLYSDISKSR